MRFWSQDGFWEQNAKEKRLVSRAECIIVYINSQSIIEILTVFFVSGTSAVQMLAIACCIFVSGSYWYLDIKNTK